MSKMDSVVHFEMLYDDRERMAKFYRDAFGWQTRMLGEEMGNYVIATTTGAVPRNQARSMAACTRESPTGQRSIRHSSSRSITFRPQ
jgi:predicted enzyme related to lactoylglutathione lyase